MRSAKIIFVTLALAATTSYCGLLPLSLPYLPPLSVPNLPIVGDLFTVVAAGVTVSTPINNGTTISIGAVAVPLQFLCGQLVHDTCRLCYIDCIVAHNASYGYGCGGNAGGDKCLCEYDRTKPVPSIDTMCGNYAANAGGLPAVNAAIDQVLVTILRLRYQTVLCNPLAAANETCGVECPTNHWAQSGTCAGYNETDSTLSQGYCICKY